jgi:hypothetical protein
MRANSADTTRSCRPVGWAASLLAVALGRDSVGQAGYSPSRGEISGPVGAWRSADGAVRLDIRTDGTYDLDGVQMTLHDDSGLDTPVALHDGVLEMAGHRLGRA